MGYVYIQTPVGQVAAKLQGDRVETPAYIIEKGLKPDAEYYIHHQLMNPLAQLFGIMVEKMPGFVAPVWSDSAEGRIGQREMIASDLLFREGLASCSSAAKREFMKKLGATAAAAAPKPRITLSTATAGPATAPATATIARTIVAPSKKTQMRLTSLFKDTAFIDDQNLMNGMKAAVASRKASIAAKAVKASSKETSPQVNGSPTQS